MASRVQPTSAQRVDVQPECSVRGTRIWPELGEASIEHTPFHAATTTSRGYAMLFLYNCVVDRTVLQCRREVVAGKPNVVQGLGLDAELWPHTLREWTLCDMRELAVVLQPGITTQTRCANVFRGLLLIAHGDIPIGATVEICVPPGKQRPQASRRQALPRSLTWLIQNHTHTPTPWTCCQTTDL